MPLSLPPEAPAPIGEAGPDTEASPSPVRQERMSVTPYYQDAAVTLYHGRMEDVVPLLDLAGLDCALADPPYAETSLAWDRWPTGWVKVLETAGVRQLWCFGSMRMFLGRAEEFDRWKFAQDVVWEKNMGSSSAADRFKRIHECACHFYRGPWGDLFHEPPRTDTGPKVRLAKRADVRHWGAMERTGYTSEADGPRIAKSIIRAKNCKGYAVNETQKPEAIVEPLLLYSVPPGGLVLDLFSGSGTVAAVAKRTGRRCISIEAREEQCELAALRLQRPWTGEAPTPPGQVRLWTR